MAEPTCQQKLAEAKTALHALLTGKSVMSVGYGERRVQYTQANIADLRAYIQQLEAECGSNPNCARRRPIGVVW